MIPAWSAIKTMPGSKVLALLRDVLLAERWRIASLEVQMIALGLVTRRDPARHAAILALDAAADGVLFMLAQGAELAAERAGEPPNWVANEADKRRWLRDLDRKQKIFVDFANQARAALLADELEGEEQAGDGDDAGAY